jgi:hypothetical protein
MDLSQITAESEKIKTVIDTIKNDPNLLNEFKENPQEVLGRIGVELNENQLSLVTKLVGYEVEAEGVFGKIKDFLGGFK